MNHKELRKEFNSKVRQKFLSKVSKIDEETGRKYNECERCGIHFDIQVHHINALFDGGTNEFNNLVCLCGTCHNEWHSIYENEFTFDSFIKETFKHIDLIILSNWLHFHIGTGDMPLKPSEIINEIRRHTSVGRESANNQHRKLVENGEL